MRHRGWVLTSGALWFAMGIVLMYKGLSYVAAGQSPLGHWIVFSALIVGFLKGRLVLVKTVKKMVERIYSLTLPIRFSQVYTRSYWILIGSMMMLGMVFRFLALPVEVRGFIDITIGSALVNGAMLYFRAVRTVST